jgi:hypothetical protein
MLIVCILDSMNAKKVYQYLHLHFPPSTNDPLFNFRTIKLSQERNRAQGATSSPEAEYMALGTGVKESIWIQRMFEDVARTMSSIRNCPSKNPKGHVRTKNIDTICHRIWEYITTVIDNTRSKWFLYSNILTVWNCRLCNLVRQQENGGTYCWGPH